MKIALLGSAQSVHRAPFKDENYDRWIQGRVQAAERAHGMVPGDWDIWGCSPGCWAVIPRATRWFEVHRWEPGQPWFSVEYTRFLQSFKGPVYTGAPIPEIPSAVVYPIDRMEARFGSYFFTSSLALMLALAIDTIEQIRRARRSHQEAKREALRHDAGVPSAEPRDGVMRVVHTLPAYVAEAELERDDAEDTIGMWGVDMAAHEEYAYQRPGCQFFILEALRRGIKFYLPPESDLMRPMPVYGISEWDHNYIKLTQRARELNSRKQLMDAQLREAQEQLVGISGEMQALNSFVNTWTTPYGLPHGVTLECLDGNLGGGITHLDTRPLDSHAAAVSALAAPPRIPDDVVRDAHVGRELCQVLGEHAKGEGAAECLRRIIHERDAAVAQLQRPRAPARMKRRR